MEFIREENAYRKYDEKGNMIAEITFPDVDKTTWEITHTFVDKSLAGQGIAAKLTEQVCDAARKEGKKLTLSCSYAKKWFEKNESQKDLLI